MKKYIVVLFGIILALIIDDSVYANTSFNTKRKSLNIYEKYDLLQIIDTDSKNLKYNSSDESIATVSSDGKIFTKKQGEFTVTVSDENSSDTCNFSSGYYVGIDVSSYNNDVDWKKVKEFGIDFAMIRSSYGWYDEIEDKDQAYDFQYDKSLLNNLKGASENNIPFGIYHFSYAKNKKEAELEAEYVLNAINNYAEEYKNNMTLPIAYDVEYIKTLSKKDLTDVVISFCSKIYEAGYTPIIYSNRDFFVNSLDLEKLNALAYGFWYAYYTNNPDFSDKITVADTSISPIMWQYTDNGSVEGANTDNGTVDMNILYMNERVKVSINIDGQVIEEFGVDKESKVSTLPDQEKNGFVFEGYKDENDNIIGKDYVFHNDTVLTPIFNKIKITDIELNKNKFEISSAKDYYIYVDKIEPKSATLEGEKIVFKSDNESVAKVDNEGKITPISNGTCNIICMLESDSTIKAIAKVNVHFGYVKGDLNSDGVVNANDAAVALDLYKFNNALEEYLIIGDMDENGVINANDAALILDTYKYGE